MSQEKGKGTGEPGWTGQEKDRGAPGSGDAGAAGDATPKGGYGGDSRAATESAAARVEKDADRKGGEGRDGGDPAGSAPEADRSGQNPKAQ